MVSRRALIILAPVVVLIGVSISYRAGYTNAPLCPTNICAIPIDGPGPPFALAVDTRARRVFVVTTTGPSGSISVLDATSGAHIGASIPISSPQGVAVDEQANQAFVISSLGMILVLDGRTGTLRRTIHLRVALYTVAVAPRAGRAFVGMAIPSGGAIGVIDTHSGALLSTVGHAPPATDIGGGPMVVDERTNRVFALGDRGVGVLDARTGALVHTVPIPQTTGIGILWLMAVDERAGRVLVGAGPLSILDARTGQVRRTPPGTRDALALVVDEHNNHAFVANGSGLTKIDTRTGRVLRTIPMHVTASAGAVALDPRRNRLFVSSGAVVKVLDTRSGQVLSTVAGLSIPGHIAVDTGTGHAFVLTGGMMAPVLDRWGWVPRWLRARVPFLPQQAPPPHTFPGSVTMLNV